MKKKKKKKTAGVDSVVECLTHAVVSSVSRSGSDSSGYASLCATSVSSSSSSSHEDNSSSDFFSTTTTSSTTNNKKVDTAPIKPTKSIGASTPTPVTNNKTKPSKNLFSMLDHMLVRHDRSMMKHQKQAVNDDEDDESDDDGDNLSCTSSIASYNSLNFGDDGRRKGYMYDDDDDDGLSDCDTLSTTSSDKSSLSSSCGSDDEEEEDDVDDSSCSSDDSDYYFDEDDVAHMVGNVEDVTTNAPREEVCNDETSYVSETDRVEGYNDEGDDDDDDDDCSISTYGSQSTSAANSLVVDLKRVPSTESLRRKMTIHDEPPRPQRPPPQKPKKRVHFNENARVKTIRHLNDMTEKEIRRIYINSQEASEIRMQCLELVQRMEEREVLADLDVRYSNDKDLEDDDCTRGLEKHTAINNEELIQRRQQLYASVFKIQAFKVPGGFMDVEGTIAEICTKLTQESVEKALKYGASDAKQAR